MSTRFGQLGDMEDLEPVITYDRQALALRPRGHPDRDRSLISIAITFPTRFEQSGNVGYLEEAIRYHHHGRYECTEYTLIHNGSLHESAIANWPRN
jgi:hypothetical protein